MSDKKMDLIITKLTSIEERLTKLESSLSNSSTSSTKKILTVKKSSSKKKTKKVIVQTGNIQIVKHPNVCRLTGDTYDKKHIIKQFKGYWTPEIKGWTVKIEHYDSIYEKLNESTKNLTVTESDEVIEDQGNYDKSKKKSKPAVQSDTKSSGSYNVGDLYFLSDSD